MGQVIDITIAGIPLKLKTSYDPERVDELVTYVDKKFQEALSLSKSGSIQNVALLVSLNIAEDLVKLKAQVREELGRLESQTRQVISELESSRLTRMGIVNQTHSNDMV